MKLFAVLSSITIQNEEPVSAAIISKQVYLFFVVWSLPMCSLFTLKLSKHQAAVHSR